MLQTITTHIKKFWLKTSFFVLGLGSLIWFLVRVIPKPSRAGYPCMKAAFPIATSFVTYLVGITSVTFFFRKARERMMQSKIIMALVFIILGASTGFVAMVSNTYETYAINGELITELAANQPIGIAKGIFPGRVVWEHNTNATNENCSNSSGDYWYQDDNTDQTVVSQMLSDGLQHLAGKETDAEAWDALFKFFNNEHGNGDKGYTSGEKIAIKVNMNSIWYDANKGINTSPQIMYAVLDQLINVVGVAQADISIGDPNCSMIDPAFNKCYAEFPSVTYWGNGGGKVSAAGSSTEVFIPSDSEFETSKLPQAYLDAAYLINLPVFKKHHRAGISIAAKNHFGSVAKYKGGAWFLHNSLPVPDANETGQDPNGEYGVYRCFVDIMGHKDLGGKTLVYVVDGTWGSTNWGHPPIKWRMAPFNDDWPNSLFLAQDPVALESVCYDFLYYEFDEDHPTEGLPATSDKGPFPHFAGTDDYLLQAADPANRPTNIKYDPENDGSELGSLGTHEHWNNVTDKQYSRNLGTGNGIELVSKHVVTATEHVDYIPEGFELSQNYPNPFSESTTIRYTLAVPSSVQIRIYSTSGELIHEVTYSERMVGEYEYLWDITNSGRQIPEGSYICVLDVSDQKGTFTMSNKMTVIR